MATNNLPKNAALSSQTAIDAMGSTLSVFLGLQKQFFEQAGKNNVNISATGKPVHRYATLKAEEANIERAFYARQEATRILDNPKAPSRVPENVQLTKAEITQAVDTMTTERAHLAKEALTQGHSNSFNPPPKLGS